MSHLWLLVLVSCGCFLSFQPTIVYHHDLTTAQPNWPLLSLLTKLSLIIVASFSRRSWCSRRTWGRVETVSISKQLLQLQKDLGMSRRFDPDHLGSELLYHHHHQHHQHLNNSVRQLEATPLQQQPSTEQTDSEQTVTSHLSIPHFALHRQVNYLHPIPLCQIFISRLSLY